ncbi:hypothetical protein Pcinc_019048 [Petrolisthes cinctipes]|uniref:F-box domain-containing protein n=1 Tax=Petrolisthes cinctipes TaxID=88211 RepID=A0AAE1FLN5_PETCI|nr:hypothetical protein Pcinc_019048 [Petrolisthes cinctipes]
MEVNISYLPDEILLLIFSILPSVDLLAVARVCKRFNDIASDGRVVRDIDLRKAYHYKTDDLREFFRPRCLTITHLNANHMYWIKFPALVEKLKNVQSLHMLGSSLTFKQLLSILKSCQKVEHLSITWPDDVKTNSFALVQTTAVRLRSLAVLVSQYPISLLTLLQYTTSLTSLTITNHHAPNLFAIPSSVTSPVKDLCLPNLTDLIVDHVGGSFSYRVLGRLVERVVEAAGSTAEWCTFWINTSIRIHMSSPLTTVVPKCKRLFLLVNTGVYEELKQAGQLPQLHHLFIDGETPQIHSLSPLLRSCSNLRSLHMHGLNITLDLRQVCEASPYLQRLSVCCQPQLGPVFTKAVSCLTHLTHLTVPVCALIGVLDEVKVEGREERSMREPFLKKQRVGVSSRENAHLATFNLVLDNCPHLVVLEIGFSGRLSCSPKRVWWECLENIQKLTSLTHLTLDGVPITSGAFLIQIAKGCQRLEFLRLRHLGPSGNCTYLSHLAQALPHCYNLRHLRVEQNYLAPSTGLWTGLQSCQFLERLLVLSQSDGRELDLVGLDALISSLPHLVFVFVGGSHTPKSKCAAITKKYKHSNRAALVVLVRPGLWDVFEDSNTETRLIPPVHFNEMVTFRSWAFTSYAYPSMDNV